MRQFYLQDSRSYRGNDMCWWADKGYTTNLAKARVFTEAEAQAMHNNRASDIPWPKDYIDERARPVVDMQDCIKSQALAGSTVNLHPYVRLQSELTNCHHCGAFMNEAQRYVCGCPKCVENSQGIPE